jgi:RNA recognition motif-containing protein
MNIYISNLSEGTSDADLQTLFAAYGDVSSARVITDKYTGRSRGFGFVEMSNEVDAQRAILELNDSLQDGQNIGVAIAKPRPKTDRPSYGGGNSRGGGDRRGGYNSSRRY